MDHIGRHTYRNLKSFPKSTLTEEEIKAIEQYESVNKTATEEQKQFSQEYSKLLASEQIIEEIELTKNDLWNQFLTVYREYYKREFIRTEDYIENVKCVMLYFLQDDEFFNCKRLVKDINEPSFEKGLLIVGDFGNGKSSVMKTIHLVLQSYPSKSFAFKDANQVVGDFEACDQPIDRDLFWKRMLTGRCLFDDVKTEGMASNYGKKNLFKDILERRYERSLITYLCCNYSEDNPGDLTAALDEFGIKYGGRVYDRLKQMFNIVEFKGKSQRK